MTLTDKPAVASTPAQITAASSPQWLTPESLFTPRQEGRPPSGEIRVIGHRILQRTLPGCGGPCAEPPTLQVSPLPVGGSHWSLPRPLPVLQPELSPVIRHSLRPGPALMPLASGPGFLRRLPVLEKAAFPPRALLSQMEMSRLPSHPFQSHWRPLGLGGCPCCRAEYGFLLSAGTVMPASGRRRAGSACREEFPLPAPSSCV